MPTVYQNPASTGTDGDLCNKATGGRKVAKSGERTPDEAGFRTGVIVVGQQQAELVPVVELLTRLSPRNVRLVENIVRCVLAEQVTVPEIDRSRGLRIHQCKTPICMDRRCMRYVLSGRGGIEPPTQGFSKRGSAVHSSAIPAASDK